MIRAHAPTNVQTKQGGSAVSIPPFNTIIYVSVYLYWGLATFIAWSLLWALSGYLYGYLHGRPKYIIVRRTVVDMTTQCNCPNGRHTPDCYERAIERLKAQTPEGCQTLEEENRRLRVRVETLQVIVQSCPSCGPVWHAIHEEPLPRATGDELRADVENSAEGSTEPHSA